MYDPVELVTTLIIKKEFSILLIPIQFRFKTQRRLLMQMFRKDATALL